MSGIMFILPYYTTELNTNNLHILSTPFPGVPDLFLEFPAARTHRVCTAYCKKENRIWGFCNTTNSMAADKFAKFPDLEPTKAKEAKVHLLYWPVKLSPLLLTLSLTPKSLRAYRDSWLHCSFSPGLFWLEHINYYIVLGNTLQDYQAKNNHCNLLAWTHVVIRFS